MGPESRGQTRSVGQWWKCTRARLAPARLEDAGGALLGGVVVDEDVDVFDAGEMADDFGVDPGDGLEFSRPVIGVVRPGDPGGGVRRPLGGHAVALVARSAVRLLGHFPSPMGASRKRCTIGW